MCDDRVITLFDWQKVPLGYTQRLAAVKHLLGSLEAQVKPLFQQAKSTAADQ